MKDNFEYALQFAILKHKGQLDKGWTPYIQHLLGVWSRVRFANMHTQIAALLHDTKEDTATTFEELATEFGQSMADTIQLLTHEKGVSYRSYIQNIIDSGDTAAIRVKIADLEDNSSEFRQQRLPERSRRYFQQRAKTQYEPARQSLLKALENLEPTGGGSI